MTGHSPNSVPTNHSRAAPSRPPALRFLGRPRRPATVGNPDTRLARRPDAASGGAPTPPPKAPPTPASSEGAPDARLRRRPRRPPPKAPPTPSSEGAPDARLRRQRSGHTRRSLVAPTNPRARPTGYPPQVGARDLENRPLPASPRSAPENRTTPATRRRLPTPRIDHCTLLPGPASKTAQRPPNQRAPRLGW